MSNHRKHIIFCSSSYFEFDRRIQRIIAVLSDEFDISWISRAKNKNSVHKYCHLIIVTCFFKKGPFFYLEFNLRLFLALLANRNYHCISSVDIETLPSAWLASRLLSKTIVFDSHELFHEVPELKGKNLRRFVWKTLSRFLFTRIRYKYTVNASLKAIFREEFKTDFDIIMNVPNKQQYTELPKIENRRLIYLGVVNNGRGLELAIDAMAELKNYELHVLGEGDLFDQMKSAAQSSQASNRIFFHGFVEPAQISEHLSQASIGLNMLDPESGNYYYSLANKHFDYIHAGLPVIAMNFPEYKSIQDEFPFSILMDSYDVQSVIRGVRALELPGHYNTCQNNALAASENYNWQTESKKLKKIYKHSMS